MSRYDILGSRQKAEVREGGAVDDLRMTEDVSAGLEGRAAWPGACGYWTRRQELTRGPEWHEWAHSNNGPRLASLLTRCGLACAAQARWSTVVVCCGGGEQHQTGPLLLGLNAVICSIVGLFLLRRDFSVAARVLCHPASLRLARPCIRVALVGGITFQARRHHRTTYHTRTPHTNCPGVFETFHRRRIRAYWPSVCCLRATTFPNYCSRLSPEDACKMQLVAIPRWIALCCTSALPCPNKTRKATNRRTPPAPPCPRVRRNTSFVVGRHAVAR